MRLRWLQGVLAVLFIAVLVGVPAFALRPLAGTPDAKAAPDEVVERDVPEPAAEQESESEVSDELTEEGEGAGRCHGIQRAYWAVTLNPGRGEGKTAAAAELSRVAAERGCELADTPPEGWRGGPPSWAGGPPPWAGNDDDDAESAGGRGPRWARERERPGRGPRGAAEGDGPPWGLAWGYWLEHGDEDTCARIQARLEAHPNAKVPEDLREGLHDRFGCDLP